MTCASFIWQLTHEVNFWCCPTSPLPDWEAIVHFTLRSIWKYILMHRIKIKCANSQIQIHLNYSTYGLSSKMMMNLFATFYYCTNVNNHFEYSNEKVSKFLTHRLWLCVPAIVGEKINKKVKCTLQSMLETELRRQCQSWFIRCRKLSFYLFCNPLPNLLSRRLLTFWCALFCSSSLANTNQCSHSNNV